MEIYIYLTYLKYPRIKVFKKAVVIVGIMFIVMYYKHWFLYIIFGTKPYKNFYYILAAIGILNFGFAVMMQRVVAVPLPKFTKPSSLMDDLLYMNCGPYGCGDEMFVVLVTILALKEFLVKLPWRLTPIKTDYTAANNGNSRVPAWEREYELCKIDEYTLDRMYLNLMLQIVLGLFFLQAIPLAPLFLFFMNVWDISYHAHHIVKGCRRPLVRNSTGIGAWQQVIIAVGYAVALFNILCVSLSSEMVERIMYNIVRTNPKFSKQFTHYKSNYATYYSFVMSWKGRSPCKYAILYGDYYIPLNRYWQPKRYKWWGIIVAGHATIVFAILVRWLITRCPKDIKETVKTEQYITYRYYLAKGVTK